MAVNQDPPRNLDKLILSHLDGATSIEWKSPLFDDDFAEYRDEAFLRQIGEQHLADELARFWPRRGPQWDALAVSDAGDVLLVEAKAHIGELHSPPSGAEGESRKIIEKALQETAAALGANARIPWGTVFYQLTNRVAHLHFLRKTGIKAWLVLVNFVGDVEMKGPRTEAEWAAAYEIVWHVLGVPSRHALLSFIVHVCPDVRLIASGR
jgi:hypothetical protein